MRYKVRLNLWTDADKRKVKHVEAQHFYVSEAGAAVFNSDNSTVLAIAAGDWSQVIAVPADAA